MCSRLIILLFLYGIGNALNAQSTAGNEVLNSFKARKNLSETSILKDYPVRNIGPTIQGGRLVDIDVNNKNPKEFYVGFASGGLFKTVNNGITFKPVFDNIDALGIGDFALSQSNANILYVGTGEKNSSRSSYAGSGVYKTSDGGETWTHCGLTESQHIGRIVIHPGDDNIVWVGVIGPLYSHTQQRGIFKSTDGGKSWKQTLYINDSTGVIDLVINPQNPKQLIAAAWERSRKAWNFKGYGSSSGIYHSEDGGETWTRSMAGFAEGNKIGRIGLKISPSKPEVVYAVLDNHNEIQKKTEVQDFKYTDKLQVVDIKKLSKEDFLKLDDKKLEDFLKDNNYPKKYTPEVVKRDIKEGRYTPKDVADYLGGDANADLFNSKITGAEVYRSDDSGRSWKRVNSYELDGIYYTYGYYFGEIEVSPNNSDHLYIYGVPLLKSKDGGKTWHRIDTLKGVKNVHVDHHALWCDPTDPQHLLLGNDGGLYQSYDEGATWNHINNMPVGQFYSVNVDMETPYNVYGGLQDNGVLKGSSKSIPNETKHWEWIFWGDGMCVAPNPNNSKTVYTGYQFGNYFKLDIEKNKTHKITPQHDIAEQPIRWNWRTPLFLSKHNPDIIYTAGNKVFRSLNKGETWEVISNDLTKNLKQGNVPFSSIASLSESPIKFGLLYAGTDDGNVWVSKNSGGEWNAITNGLPSNKWVSSITPSSHDERTVFVSMNGYRDDDFKTYLFSSTDYGKTWQSIKGNLPESVANIVIQDPVNPELLYCGLDNGAYASLDRGKTWHLFNEMLNVAAYDMIVHPRENELVVGSHGRSVFVTDVKPLQLLKEGASTKAIIAFAPETVKHNDKWGQREYAWSSINEPSVTLMYYVGKETATVDVEVFDEKIERVRKFSAPGNLGFHQVKWDLKVVVPTEVGKKNSKANPPATAALQYPAKGKYKVKFSSKDGSAETFVEIK